MLRRRHKNHRFLAENSQKHVFSFPWQPDINIEVFGLNFTHGQTDGTTEPQQRYYIPTAMLRRRHKNHRFLAENSQKHVFSFPWQPDINIEVFGLNFTHGQTDGTTEPQQRYYIPTAMLRRRHKNHRFLAENSQKHVFSFPWQPDINIEVFGLNFTHGQTDGTTEPQQRYYIPTATRYPLTMCNMSAKFDKQRTLSS